MAAPTASDTTAVTPWRRVVFTVAVLLAFRLAATVPLAGIDARAFAELSQGGGIGLERVSLAALGLTPLFSALLIYQLGHHLLPRAGAAASRPLHRSRRTAWPVWLALAFAALQAYGIAIALEQAGRIVAEPGLWFRSITIATLVGSSALVIWFADEITRRGVGSGFWLLLSIPVLIGLPKTFAADIELQRMGMVASPSWPFAAAFIVLGAMALVALDRARTPDAPALRLSGPWPPILGVTAIGWAGAIAIGLAPGGDAWSQWLSPGQPATLAGLALLVLLFVWLRLVRHPQAAHLPRAQLIRLAAIAGGVQALIVVGGDLVQRLSPVAIDGMWLVILVTMMLRIRDGD